MFYLIKFFFLNQIFFDLNQITIFKLVLANISILYSLICCYFLFKRSCWKHGSLFSCNPMF